MQKIINGIMCMLIISSIVPITGAINININVTEKELNVDSVSDFWLLSHVVIRADEGSCFIVGSHFTQGLGRCNALIADVEDNNGYIKITPLLDTSNSTEIEGGNRLAMFGFIGFQSTRNGVYVNGIALIVFI